MDLNLLVLMTCNFFSRLSLSYSLLPSQYYFVATTLFLLHLLRHSLVSIFFNIHWKKKKNNKKHAHHQHLVRIMRLGLISFCALLKRHQQHSLNFSSFDRCHKHVYMSNNNVFMWNGAQDKHLMRTFEQNTSKLPVLNDLRNKFESEMKGLKVEMDLNFFFFKCNSLDHICRIDSMHFHGLLVYNSFGINRNGWWNCSSLTLFEKEIQLSNHFFFSTYQWITRNEKRAKETWNEIFKNIHSIEHRIRNLTELQIRVMKRVQTM